MIKQTLKRSKVSHLRECNTWSESCLKFLFDKNPNHQFKTFSTSHMSFSREEGETSVGERNKCMILDRRDLSPNEQIMLAPSLLKYGNGLVLRVINFKIEKQPSFDFHEILRSAVNRVQRGQPLLQSKIVRNEKPSKLDYAFQLMDEFALPVIPIFNIEREVKEFENDENPLLEYLEKVMTQKSYDLQRDFQLELYYYMKGNDLSLIVRYSHAIGDGISISNFIGQLLRECENVSMERDSEQVGRNKLLSSRLNTFSAKLKAIKYLFPFAYNMISNKVNQSLIQFSKRYEQKTTYTKLLEIEGERLENLKKFTKKHKLTINSCLIPLISLAYLKASQEVGREDRHQTNCVRVGYPTGLSKIPEFSQILDGSTLSVHVGVLITDLIFESSNSNLQTTIINQAKQILTNHATNFENQFILTNILQSPLTRQKAMAKTLKDDEVFLAGLPVNIILTNNGLVDSVKRSYIFPSNSMTISSMFTMANTSALAGCIACGALTLPSDEKHSAKLILSLSCMEPIISKEALDTLHANLEVFLEKLLADSTE